MKSFVWFSVALGTGCFATVAPPPSVGPGGYTNAFGIQPAAVDWSTLSIGSASSDITTAAGLDAAVQTVPASTVNAQVGLGVNEPPDFSVLAQWSPAGLYLQTRPTGNDFTALMCTLVNNLGSDAATVTISYDFTKAGTFNAEEVDGHRVYYSFTGAASSWLNIPQLSTATAGRLTATVTNFWPSGSTLYVLWADDNGSGSPDLAMQIDNFFVRAVPTTPLIVAITSQPQSQTVAALQPVSFSVGVVGNPPPTFQWYRNNVPIAGATNSIFAIASAQPSDNGAAFRVTAANTVNGDDYIETSSNAILTVRGAIVVGPAGSGTSTFSTLPTVSDGWSTLSVSGTAADIANGAALSAAVQTTVASLVNNPLASSSSNPPEAAGAAVWSTAGHVQTRPIGNACTLLLASLQNRTGASQSRLVISYSLTVAGDSSQVEEVYGHQVYYSLTGVAGSWVEIPNMAQTDNTLGTFSKSAALDLSATPWAAGSFMYLLWADDNGSGTTDTALEIDNVVFATPSPPVFVNATDPTNRTVGPCISTTLAATAVGVPAPSYQWYRNNFPVDGATHSSYTLTNSAPGDYFVRASNPSGFADSHHAIVSFILLPPLGLVGAVGQLNPTLILISFSAALEPASINPNPNVTFVVRPAAGGPALNVASATVTDFTNVLLVTDTRASGVDYDLTINPPGVSNACAQVTGASHIDSTILVLDIDATHLWRYNQTGIDPGPTWKDIGYDDSSWPQGVAVLDGKKPQPPGRTSITNTPVRTQLNLTNSIYLTTDIPTYNFRTHVVLPAIPRRLAAVTFWDDGGALFINGTLALRLRDDATNVFASYSQNQYSGDAAVFEGPFDLLPSNMVAGDNLIAVEIKQVGSGSSDITMGLQLIAVVPNLTGPPAPLQFAAASFSASETNDNAQLSVVRSAPTNTAVSVDYVTADGTATGGSDYLSTHGTLFFAPGEVVKTFMVPLLDDVIYEGDETVQISLTNPSGGASLGSISNALLHIIDNESPTPAILSQPQAQSALGGGAATFTISATGLPPLRYQWRLNGANLPGAISSNLTILNVQAVNAGAYTVTVSNSAGGTLSAPALLSVRFTLNVSTDGNGTSARDTNLVTYALGAVVMLTAIPNSNYEFLNWSGDAGGNANPLAVVMNTNRLIQAHFISALETNTYNGVTRVAIRGAPAIFVNGQFIIRPTSTNRGPAQISLLTTFTNGVIIYTLDGSDPRFSAVVYQGPFVLANPATIRALAYNSDFTRAVEADPLRLIFLPVLSVTTPGGGNVAMDPPDGPYFSNSTAILTATPANGWTFLGWNGDITGTNPVATVSVQRDRCVEAVFGTTLQTSVALGAGSILVEPEVDLHPYGAVVRLTAVPQSGNYFGFWGNAASGTNFLLNFAVTNPNPNVAAGFFSLSGGQSALTIISRGNGSIQITPWRNLYLANQKATLTALPDPGQAFTGWSGDGVGATNPLVVTMTQSKVITAGFTKRPQLAFARCGTAAGAGPLQLVLVSTLATENEIMVSSNLVDWSDWIRVTNFLGTVHLRDESATNNSPRFYRAVQP